MNSSSSTNLTAEPLLFNVNGASLRVFTQPEGITGRPRVVKLLKSQGATISKDPKDADVVLVNDDSTPGRQFIRVWGGDGGKVVLRYQWVDACVTARRVLNDTPNWGGYRTVDDGLPLGNGMDEDMSDVEPSHKPKSALSPCFSSPNRSTDAVCPRSPLPTPRQSPDQPVSTPNASSSKSASSGSAIHKRRDSNATALSKLSLSTQHPPTDHNDATLEDDTPMRDPAPKEKKKRGSTLDEHEAFVPIEDLELLGGTGPHKGKGKQRQDDSFAHSHIGNGPLSGQALEEEYVTGLFTREGRRLKFHVQIAYPRRNEHLKKIRAHQGTIEANLLEADYFIPYTNQKESQLLIESAVANKIPTVKMSFVDDCISRNRLLDYQDYQWVPLPETKPVPRGKRKSSGVVPRESEDEDNEDDIPLAKKVKAAKRGPGRPPKPEIQKSAESSHKKPGKTNTDGPPAKPKIEQLKAPLKTPVKFESPQPSTSTKSDARLAPNLYTEEEVKLALEETLHYHSTEDVPVWARLCERLHEQMPSHTARSWNTFTRSGRHQEDFEHAAKRGRIQYRKRKDQEARMAVQVANAASSTSTPHFEGWGQQQQGVNGGDAAQVSIQRPIPTPPAPLGHSQDPATVERDIDRFVQFLTIEEGDLIDDEALKFAALATNAPWRTAEQWAVFWGIHHAPILERYQVWVSQQPALQS